MNDPVENLRALIRDIPDFPKPGIVFKDITPLLADPAGLAMAVEVMANPFRHDRVDLVVGAESRGFIFGTAVAYALGVGFIPIRKSGKLPGETIGRDFVLEYGEDRIEIHKGAIEPGHRVLLVDDLIATGGTAEAALELLKEIEAVVVEAAFVVALPDLGGIHRLRKTGADVFWLSEFAGD